MKRSTIASLLRDEANAIARQVRRMLKGTVTPQCVRVSRNRGRAHFSSAHFSVPYWIIGTHPAFRLWVIVHEVCHLVPCSRSHGPLFFRAESEVMEKFGWRLVRAERGPYIQEIRDLQTNWPVCDQYGRAFC